MNNREVAKLLYNIAVLVDIVEDGYKPKAYRYASRVIEEMPEDINKVDDLESIPGVGEGIAKKIRDMLKLGYSPYYEKLKKKVPVNVDELIEIPGIGPKTIKRLYLNLKVKNKKDLLKAAKEHKVRLIKRLGKHIENNILLNIDSKKKNVSRKILFTGMESSRKIVEALKSTGLADKISVAGSVRRRKENVGDIDIVLSSKSPDKVMERFVSLPWVAKVLEKGSTKSSVVIHNGLQVDLRVVETGQFGSALQHFTGSKDHNIALRRMAQKKGMKINEYGVFKGNKRIAGETEESVYSSLDMDFIPPELRENRGEIEAALNHRLPKLIERKDIKGDMHVHSYVSHDSSNRIEDIVDYCKNTLKYRYVAITDHVHYLKQNYLDKLKERNKKIDDLNSTLSNFKILKGLELDIKRDGKLSMPKEMLGSYDIIIASVHYEYLMPAKEMTKRIMKALATEGVAIFGHPTARKMFSREPIKYDKEKIFRFCADRGIALEIDSYIDRMDLNDSNVLLAKEFGAKFSIDTDSHEINHLNFMEFGIYMARRGWLTKKDVINARKNW